MCKDDIVYVGHMLDTARKATHKLKGKTRKEFDSDENLRLALAHLLQIIGEAANRVSREFKSDHAGIPWEDIIGMRHKVVHDYLNVDQNVIWKTVTEELAPLVVRLESLVKPEASKRNRK